MWKKMYNLDFKVVEFDYFKIQAGLLTFVLSAKQWIEKINAICMTFTIIDMNLTMC